MNTLKMKITGYDQDSHSLLVAFASDSTKSPNPEDYPSYAYQPLTMWPDVTDLNEIKLKIAQSGVQIVEQQALKEQFLQDEQRIGQMRDLVGDVTTYPIQQLVTPEPQVPFQEV